MLISTENGGRVMFYIMTLQRRLRFRNLPSAHRHLAVRIEDMLPRRRDESGSAINVNV